MILKNESFPNGIHNVIIADVSEVEGAVPPALKFTYTLKENDLSITQRYQANLTSSSPLLGVIFATLGEAQHEIDTDTLIGCECTIEVAFVERNNRYYQNVVNVFPIDNSEDEESEWLEEESESYDDDSSSEDLEADEVEAPTRITRKKRRFR
jgi:hypothetical protein